MGSDVLTEVTPRSNDSLEAEQKEIDTRHGHAIVGYWGKFDTYT